MTTTQQDIVKSLEPYQHQQQIILRIIRKHGQISDKDFDRIFTNYKTIKGKMYRRRSKFKPMWYLGDQHILGSLNRHSDWDKWLDLTQLMASMDMVTITKQGDRYIYSLPE